MQRRNNMLSQWAGSTAGFILICAGGVALADPTEPTTPAPVQEDTIEKDASDAAQSRGVIRDHRSPDVGQGGVSVTSPPSSLSKYAIDSLKSLPPVGMQVGGKILGLRVEYICGGRLGPRCQPSDDLKGVTVQILLEHPNQAPTVVAVQNNVSLFASGGGTCSSAPIGGAITLFGCVWFRQLDFPVTQGTYTVKFIAGNATVVKSFPTEPVTIRFVQPGIIHDNR